MTVTLGQDRGDGSNDIDILFLFQRLKKIRKIVGGNWRRECKGLTRVYEFASCFSNWKSSSGCFVKRIEKKWGSF
jgi:hypothetical protein